MELGKVSWRSSFPRSRGCGDQTQLYKEKESEKRAWNARYALQDKYPWDVGLGKLVPLTIPVLPIRETMTRSLPVYVHAIAKTKTNHVLVILIISDCRSLRHVLSFVKPLERRLDFFPVTCSRGFCTCTCYHHVSCLLQTANANLYPSTHKLVASRNFLSIRIVLTFFSYAHFLFGEIFNLNLTFAVYVKRELSNKADKVRLRSFPETWLACVASVSVWFRSKGRPRNDEERDFRFWPLLVLCVETVRKRFLRRLKAAGNS